MRLSLPAIALSVCVSPFGLAAAAPSGNATSAGSPKAVPATAAPPPAVPPDAPASDAAARHAKRTACLKQAKAKKLVGAGKNSFIKDCVAAR